MVFGILFLAMGFGGETYAQSRPVITKEYCDLRCETRKIVDEINRTEERRRTSGDPPVRAAPPRVPNPESAVIAAKQTQGWAINQVPDEKICRMTAVYEGGTRFTIETIPGIGGYSVYFSNEKWASLKAGNKYKLDFSLGGAEWKNHDAEAISKNQDRIELLSRFNETFGQQLMPASYITIKYEGKTLDTLSLAGTTKSVPALVRCGQEEYRKANVDPFAE